MITKLARLEFELFTKPSKSVSYKFLKTLDSGFHWNDKKGRFWAFYKIINP